MDTVTVLFRMVYRETMKSFSHSVLWKFTSVNKRRRHY